MPRKDPAYSAAMGKWTEQAMKAWQTVFEERWGVAPTPYARAKAWRRFEDLYHLMDEEAVHAGIQIPGQEALGC